MSALQTLRSHLGLISQAEVVKLCADAGIPPRRGLSQPELVDSLLSGMGVNESAVEDQNPANLQSGKVWRQIAGLLMRTGAQVGGERDGDALLTKIIDARASAKLVVPGVPQPAEESTPAQDPTSTSPPPSPRPGKTKKPRPRSVLIAGGGVSTLIPGYNAEALATPQQASAGQRARSKSGTPLSPTAEAFVPSWISDSAATPATPASPGGLLTPPRSTRPRPTSAYIPREPEPATSPFAPAPDPATMNEFVMGNGQVVRRPEGPFTGGRGGGRGGRGGFGGGGGGSGGWGYGGFGRGGKAHGHHHHGGWDAAPAAAPAAQPTASPQMLSPPGSPQARQFGSDFGWGRGRGNRRSVAY